MALQQTSTLDGEATEGRRGLVGALAGLALAAAVAAGLGAWQARGHAADRPATAVAPAATTSGGATMTTEGAMATGGAAAPPRASYLYLLRSESEAALVRQWGAELNVLRGDTGQPAVDVATWVTDTMVADVLGLPLPPGTRVIDMR
jgi:hypothetical protein